jgi:PAS domain S-box-containing protein
MNTEHLPLATPQPSPAEGLDQIVICEKGGKEKIQKENIVDDGHRIEEAETGTKRADTPTEPGEQALRESELRYRRLFEAARDGILILEAETGRISDANPFLIEMLGFSHSELVGRPIWELGTFKDIVSNKDKFQQLQEKGYVRYENLPLETRDGRKIAVEFVSNVYTAGDRDVIQCNIRDITERSEAEKQRSRIALIIEYSGEAIVSKSVGGIIIGWNRGAEQLYGYTAEEVIGRPISILFPPDRYQEYLHIMKKVKSGETVQAFDTVRLRKDGAAVNVSVGISPIEARDSGVVGALKNGHDISRIKKLEAQFIEAQKMEVVGHLAGGVAHDFNNILGIIMGYSEMIIANLAVDSPLWEDIHQIRHATERAALLTTQLLVFSRHQTVHPVVLDLNGVLDEMGDMLRRLLDENIELTVIPGNAVGCIKADSGYIGQVLMNLLVNARDAMPNGGKLTITTESVVLGEQDSAAHKDAIPGDYVMLSVSDTGTGMTEEVKAHIFEAFFTTKPKGKGTGLGLATCQTILQQLGGHICVCSQVGRGTSFQIYFPRVEQMPEIASKPFQTGPLPRGSETLLFVEDDPAVRHLARRGLESLGYEVLSASNGQDGLSVARDHHGSPIRLVITDIIMPVMGGKVMAEWMRATYPDLKILFTSGYMDDKSDESSVQEPEIAYLAKPYSPGILACRVREMLDAPQVSL